MGGNVMTEEQVIKGKEILATKKESERLKTIWGKCDRYSESYTLGRSGSGICKLDIGFIPFSHLKELAICHYEKRIKELTKELEAL